MTNALDIHRASGKDKRNTKRDFLRIKIKHALIFGSVETHLTELSQSQADSLSIAWCGVETVSEQFEDLRLNVYNNTQDIHKLQQSVKQLQEYNIALSKKESVSNRDRLVMEKEIKVLKQLPKTVAIPSGKMLVDKAEFKQTKEDADKHRLRMESSGLFKNQRAKVGG